MTTLHKLSSLFIIALSSVTVAAEPAGTPIDEAIKRASAAADKIVAIPDSQRTFENTLGAMDDIATNLELETSMAMFMGYVHPDAAVREAAQKAEEAFGAFSIEIGKREDLYKAVAAYAATKPKLEGEQKRFLEFTLRDYKRAGMALSKEDRAKLTEIQKEIVKLGIDFNKNIAEDQTTVPLTREELKGCSDEFIAKLPVSGGVCFVSMQYPDYYPMMETCDVETTRQKMWLAYKRRAGGKNIDILEKTLKLRAQAAAILGYANAAEFEIEVRMAKNLETVKKFYTELRPLIRKKAEKDFAELETAKRAHTGNKEAQFQPWDLFFYQNLLKKEKYAVDGEKVAEYFPMDAVVEGLFSITQSLYGLEYRDVTAKAGTSERPLWHPDVKLYEVYDKANGKMIGEFYLDLYPRENKYNHAAQWSLVNHKVWSDGRVTTPLAALVCNFTKPTVDKPSLLTHEEVETFFHEFGHCLHTIVSDAKMSKFSGTNTELDFVEAPSQMFENWVWDAEVLGTFARHYRTGEKLPRELLEGMIKARHLGSGLEAEGQVYYAMTDLAYESTKDGVVDTSAVADELFRETLLYKTVPAHTHYQAAFGHLMHYQAGYYSYMWSLVYASDMFQRFKELGMLDPKAGMYYREKVISRGGTRDAMDALKDYLGREPRLDSFLVHLGLEPGEKK